VEVSGLSGAVGVSAGFFHSLALLGDGEVLSWGNNSLGELGDGSQADSDAAHPVSGLSGVTAVSAGGFTSLALLGDGTVRAWGENGDGQLGDGAGPGPETCEFGEAITAYCSRTPVAVAGLHGVTAVAEGEYHSLALLEDGSVVAWGNNTYGELGIGATTGPEKCEFTPGGLAPCSRTPVAVKGLSEVVAIAAGDYSSLALLKSGRVMAWGENAGSNSTPMSDLPQEVKGLSGISAIVAGGSLSMALRGNGTVLAWGYNDHGQLGQGNNGGSAQCEEERGLPCSNVPLEVIGLSGVTGVAIGAGAESGLVYGPLNPTVAGVTVTSTAPSSPSASAASGDLGATGPGSSSATAEAGGATVRISGTDLRGTTSVKFGPNDAESFTVSSIHSITAVSPPGNGTVDITVTTPRGTSVTSTKDQFTYGAVPRPTVTKLTPNKGPVTGATAVTITGTNFSGTTAVKFGSVDAASFTVNSATSITATSPAHAVGKVDVTVTTAGGTSATSTGDKFKYTPVITNLSPSVGPAAGGTTVTASGAGFALGTTGTTFKFGAAMATSVNCTSSTTCFVVSPAHAAGKVDVKATVSKVVSAKAAADQFKYE
jgi:hypothetical protein